MMQNQYCHMMDQTAPGEDLIQAALQQSTAPPLQEAEAAAAGCSGCGSSAGCR